MVAFVGGSGLGLFNSSLMVVGGDGARGDALLGRSGEQVYVNAGSGNLVVQRQDEYVSATGGDLSILRTYNSQGLLNDDNADNWRMGVAKTLSGLTGTLNTSGSTVTRTEGDGAVLRYSWDGAKAAYVNKDGAGAFDTLKYDAAAARWTWTDGDSQTTESYDWAGGAGKLLSSADANGNLTLFGYTGTLVTSVTSASGESTYLDYIGSNLQDIRTVRADGSQATRVRYSYDAAGRLTDTLRDGIEIDARKYDAAGRVLQTGYQDPGTQLTAGTALASVGEASDYRINQYDSAGRLKTQSLRDAAGKAKSKLEYWYFGTGQLSSYIQSQDGQDGLDHRYAYNAGDYSKVDSITLWKGAVSATTSNIYDRNGFISQVTTSGNASAANARTLVNDVRGRVLRKVQDGHTTYSLIANDEAIGSSSDSAAPVADTFRGNYVPISSEALAAGPSAYTVQAGETLQSIAKAVWGNANLWYLIADANGKTVVAQGEVITIPGRQNAVLNDYQSFTPYNPGQAVGNESPILVPPKKKSNWVAQLLVIIVMVVATIFTAGALTAGLSASLSTIMSAGASALTGGLVGTAAAAAGLTPTAFAAAVGSGGVAFTGAAAGSIISQGVGIAIGAQDSFSWRQVGLSAISAGLTAGIGSTGGIVQTASKFLNVAANAAIANALAQGIGVATGLQKSFDWRGVAASGLGAGVGSAVGGALSSADAFSGLGGLGGQIARGTVAGFAGGLTAAVMRGGRISVQQVAVDAFGNALGNSLADSPKGVGQPTTQDTGGQSLGISETDYWNTRAPTQGDRYADMFGGKASTTGGFSVEVNGAGWNTRDFQLDDGTWILRSSDANIPGRLVPDLPIDAASPSVPGYDLGHEQSFQSRGTKDAYYIPTLDPQASFRRAEIEYGNARLRAPAASDENSMFASVRQGMDQRLDALVSNAEDAAVQNRNPLQYVAAQFFPRSTLGAAFTALGGPAMGLGLKGLGAIVLTKGAPLAMGSVSAEVGASLRAGGQLRYLGNETWQSPLGLRYGPDAQYVNRIQHVLRHAEDQPFRLGEHGVFDAGRSGVVGVVDEAWSIAQRGGPSVVNVTTVGSKTVYTVDMGRPIGWVGGRGGAALGNPAVNHVQLVIRSGNQVVTAFPIR